MKTVHCAICDFSEKIVDIYPSNLDINKIDKKTFSARRLPDKIHYKIVQCKKCGLIFSREILPLDQIVKLYKESEFHYKTESKYLGKTYAEYFKKYIGIDKNLKVLDVGAGNGFFLDQLVQLGITDVWGVEPGVPTVKKAPKYLQKKIVVDVLKKNLFKNDTFDVVCCFHTLDHIVDPNAFLEIIYSILKPGGKIFFVVHNTNGLSVKLFREKSPIFDVEHIYLFNKSSLKKIFTKNKFKNSIVFDHFNTYPISYWVYLLPFPNSLKKKGLQFLNTTHIGKIPIKINPGNIGIIAEK